MRQHLTKVTLNVTFLAFFNSENDNSSIMESNHELGVYYSMMELLAQGKIKFG